MNKFVVEVDRSTDFFCLAGSTLFKPHPIKQVLNHDRREASFGSGLRLVERNAKFYMTKNSWDIQIRVVKTLIQRLVPPQRMAGTFERRWIGLKGLEHHRTTFGCCYTLYNNGEFFPEIYCFMAQIPLLWLT